MIVTIITQEGKNVLDLKGKPIIFCVDDKKYVLNEKGNFRRIRSESKKGFIKIMEGWK